MDNIPAFPSSHEYQNEQNQGKYITKYSGMTLRDYFAGQALTGVCSRNLNFEDFKNWCKTNTREQAISKSCYILADAMLNERTQQGETTWKSNNSSQSPPETSKKISKTT